MSKKREVVQKMIESQTKAFMREEIHPVDILIGVHNAMAYGNIFDEVGLDISDEQLEQLFEGLGETIKVLGELE